MIINDLLYRNDELLKNDLKLFYTLVNERAQFEIEWLDKLHNAKSNEPPYVEKFKKRYQGSYFMKIDYYNTRIITLCNCLDLLSEKELEYIYDMLICPLQVKTIMKKYNITSESKCYRHLDKIIGRMIKR